MRSLSGDVSVYRKQSSARRIVSGFWNSERIGLVIVVVIPALLVIPYAFNFLKFNPALLYSGLGVGLKNFLLPGYSQIEPNLGFTSQALGHLASSDVLQGIIPYWNPFEGLGSPLLGEMQSAALFPLTILLSFSNGQIYFEAILQVIAGAATYYLLRSLRVRIWVAVVLATAFSLNGTFSWLRNAIENPVAFLPVMLLGVELTYMASKAQVKSHRIGPLIFIMGIFFGLSAGFPETFYLDCLVVAVWGTARASDLGVNRKGALFVATLVVLGVVGLMLSAPILVPFLDYLPFADIGAHSGSFASAFLPGDAANIFGLPWAYGSIFSFVGDATTSSKLDIVWGNVGGFIVPALLLSACVGLTSGSGPLRLRIGLGSLAFLMVSRIFGWPIFSFIMNLLGGGGKVAIFRYDMPAIEMILVVLGAFGLETLVSMNRPKLLSLVGGLGGIAILGLVIWKSEGLSSKVFDSSALAGQKMLILGSYAEAGISVVLVILALTVMRFGSAQRKVTYFLAALLMLETIATFALTFAPALRAGHLDKKPVLFLQQHLGDYRFFSLGPIQPNYGSYFGIAELNVNDLPVPLAFSRIVQRRLDPNASPITFTGQNSLGPTGLSPVEALTRYEASYASLGVKYIIVPVGDSLGVNFKLVWRDQSAWIYRLPNALPIMRSQGAECQIQGSVQGTGQATCSRPGVIIFTALAMPGWHASIGGRPVPIITLSSSRLAIHVPSGVSTVAFVQRPPYEGISWVVCAIGMSLVFILMFYRRGTSTSIAAKILS